MPGEDERKVIALAVLAENFGRDFSDALLNVWLNLLEPYTAGQVAEAVKMVMGRYVFKTLPPFAVLQEALDELCARGERALSMQAMAEWGALQDAIAAHGRYAKPPLHPTTEYVLRLMGGWHAACSWPAAEIDYKRRAFTGLWQDCHGKEKVLAAGASGLLPPMRDDSGERLLPIGTLLGAVTQEER